MKGSVRFSFILLFEKYLDSNKKLLIWSGKKKRKWFMFVFYLFVNKRHISILIEYLCHCKRINTNFSTNQKNVGVEIYKVYNISKLKLASYIAICHKESLGFYCLWIWYDEHISFIEFRI